ncbi:NAD(P)-binding protein [Thozetella sp. PMI_491]|nr:NAD(P)-binding protein [Thozetella sp. PMI_491]
MRLGLEGKVVLVTGATKGIGKAIAKGFLEEDAVVHICSRSPANIEEFLQEVKATTPEAKVFGASVDVSDPEALKAWVGKCAEECGSIDVVVSSPSALAMPNTVECWQAAFQTDMMGTYNLIEAAMPHLEKSKGCIVTIASVTGRDIDFTAPSPYGAMKAAQIHYTAQLAYTIAPKGVRANTVSPGNTYFPGGVWASIESDQPEVFKKQIELNPTGRMGAPEEVADAVVFLASKRASRISGANLNVDGALCSGVQF